MAATAEKILCSSISFYSTYYLLLLWKTSMFPVKAGALLQPPGDIYMHSFYSQSGALRDCVKREEDFEEKSERGEEATFQASKREETEKHGHSERALRDEENMASS